MALSANTKKWFNRAGLVLCGIGGAIIAIGGGVVEAGTGITAAVFGLVGTALIIIREIMN